jgi:2-polyprenyl-3-methyl-5-hydroxy-6-metoxy-1,4-benzoquinol methylase
LDRIYGQKRRTDARVNARCNLCNAAASHHLFTKRGWRLERCNACGLVRVDPMPTPAQAAARYAPTAGYQLARLGGPTRYTRWEHRRTERLASITGRPPRPGARLLDIGCSTGDYLSRARTFGWSVHGLDVAKHLAVFARVKRGIPVEHGDVREALDWFAPESFTAITLWDVIEHLPQPLDTIRDLRRLLEPGGTLYLSSPNLTGWLPRFHWRVLRPMTGIWPHPEPPLHVHQFARSTVARLFTAAGFEAVRFLPDEIPLWYTSGFLGEPQWRHWVRGEPGAAGARAMYLFSLPVFLAARAFGRGDSIIALASRARD